MKRSLPFLSMQSRMRKTGHAASGLGEAKRSLPFARLQARMQKTGHAASGLGHPLYVNGQLFPNPVTISHVPGPTGNYYSVPAGLGDVDPSLGAFGAYAAYAPVLPPLGADPAVAPPPPPPPMQSEGFISPFFRVWKYVAPLSALASAYHGYKRNDSLGWALWWFLWGGLPITPVIALAQGFGEPKARTPNRPRRRRNQTPRNLRGAKNFIIGAGYEDAAELGRAPDSFKQMLSRMYGVTEADYPELFKRAQTTRRREARRRAGRGPWQTVKRAIKRRRRR